MPMPKGSIKKGTLKRLLKTIVKHYKWQLLIVIACMAITSVGSLVSSVYMKALVDDVITPALQANGLTSPLQAKLTGLIIMMLTVYTLVIITSFLYTRIMATVTQGTLYHLRVDMFDKMQNLPIKYFDTHAHGDIMSTYTNDTDATRQLIGQSLPTLFTNSITLIVSLALMLSYSFWLSIVVFASTFLMTFVVKKIGKI